MAKRAPRGVEADYVVVGSGSSGAAIAGRLAEARSELEKLGLGADGGKMELDPEFETEVRRLWRFLALAPQ